MHGLRLLAAVARASIGAALSAQPVRAFDRPPLIEQVASVFALRPVDVRCPTMQEWVGDPIWGDDPNPQRAWGYTDMVNDFSVIQPRVVPSASLVGALQRGKGRVPGDPPLPGGR
jgi:hypothetical protein